jgi:hypothetical protein
VRLLALDPGSERTGWIVVDAAASDALPVVGSGKWPNEEVLDRLRHNDGALTAEVTIIEAMSPRGMPTSRQDLETVHWAGRFYEAASRWHRVERVEREHVKRHLIGSQRPKGGPNADSRIRAVIIDRYGGIGGKAAAVGLKARQGPLYGVTADAWAALAVALTWWDELQDGIPRQGGGMPPLQTSFPLFRRTHS